LHNFELEKLIWTEDDFGKMGWHDATIWSSFSKIDDFEFILDLDYIFKWVKPSGGSEYFKYWVSPVTLVFKNVSSVKFDIDSQQGDIEVDDLLMEKPEVTPNGKFTSHIYRFVCHEGSIEIRATGFEMYVKQLPKLQGSQCFTLEERNGISFERECVAL